MAKSTKKEPGTALIKWEEQLAQEAQLLAKSEASLLGGKWFSTRNGVLSFNDNPMPNNEMVVIVLESRHENVFYEGRFDPENPSPPSCFAINKLDDDMVPHEVVEDPQSNDCAQCPNNQWGSADVGRGKACRNIRRLAMIPAGTIGEDGSCELIDDPAHFQTAEIACMKIPPTSIKGFASFVNQLAQTMRRPPAAVYTRVYLEDTETAFRVNFEALGPVPGELLDVIMARREDAGNMLEQPYDMTEREPPAPKGRNVKKPITKPAPAAKRGATPAPATKVQPRVARNAAGKARY